VRDRERISLYDLSGGAAAAPAAVPPPPAPPSIWSTPSTPSAPAAAPSPSVGPVIDASLRRLVVAYAARREELPMLRRRALAQSAEPALRRALPDVVTAAGPLAALDQLAEREGVTPYRPMHPGASSAMAWGVTSLVLPIIGILPGILAIVFGTNALRAVRSEPDRYKGEDRAKTGRLLGIIGVSIWGVVIVLIVLAIVLGGR
jgi:hypothetical protein